MTMNEENFLQNKKFKLRLRPNVSAPGEVIGESYSLYDTDQQSYQHLKYYGHYMLEDNKKPFCLVN